MKNYNEILDQLNDPKSTPSVALEFIETLSKKIVIDGVDYTFDVSNETGVWVLMYFKTDEGKDSPLYCGLGDVLNEATADFIIKSIPFMESI